MLKRVSIQNFKSLKDVTLDLQPVNLLIGPNNSGKTNFLKAFEFYPIGGHFSQNLTDFELISYKHTKQPISFSFNYLFDSSPNKILDKKESNYRYHYSSVSELIVRDGFGSIDTKVDSQYINIYNKTEKLTIPEERIVEFWKYINTKIFRPDPSKLTHQVVFSADDITLNVDCSNLISYYYYVQSNFKRNAEAIEHNLSACIPEIAYFSLPPVKNGSQSLLGLKFFDKNDNGYWADEVSEGVLYFLALLCIIHQPNPPKLLLLEEPERGIHPRRIREVMDFIFRLAEEKDIQIILTTHNEHVLDDFSTRPEAVFVFDKDEEGATYVRNLQTDIIEPTNRRNRELGLDDIDLTTNLSENWLYGLLGGVPPIV